MTAEEQKTKLGQLIDYLVPDFVEPVKAIEARLATTKDHYGDYMALLASVSKDKPTAQVVALALLKAGANRNGVSWALKCGFGIGEGGL